MSVRQTYEELLAYALSYPEAWEDEPWEGDRCAKVRKKVFVFSGCDDERFSMSTKLPDSKEDALALSWTKPTGYGLGHHGWVSFSFGADDDVPVEVLKAWIDESYRAVAPKKLIKLLDPS